MHALLVVPDTEESPGTELVADGATDRARAGDGPPAPPPRHPGELAEHGHAGRADARRLGPGRDHAGRRPRRAVASGRRSTARRRLPGAGCSGGAIGGYVGGGSNAGPAGRAHRRRTASPRLPLVLELELGLRAQSMSTQVGTLGVQQSSLLVFPIEVAVRWEAMAIGNFRLGVRGGGGLLVGSHHLSSTFDAELTEGALGLGALRRRAGRPPARRRRALSSRCAPALSKVSTDHLEARPGGAIFSVGRPRGVPVRRGAALPADPGPGPWRLACSGATLPSPTSSRSTRPRARPRAAAR